MPSKKKKYNARFPAGRIKKIMQSDEEIGKVAQAVPVVISRTLELFVESLVKKTMQITNSRNAKTLSTSHMKQCIMSEQRFDFLRELVKNVPDISVAEEAANYNEEDGQSSTEDAYPDSDTPYDLSMASTSGGRNHSRSVPTKRTNGGVQSQYQYKQPQNGSGIEAGCTELDLRQGIRQRMGGSTQSVIMHTASVTQRSGAVGSALLSGIGGPAASSNYVQPLKLMRSESSPAHTSPHMWHVAQNAALRQQQQPLQGHKRLRHQAQSVPCSSNINNGNCHPSPPKRQRFEHVRQPQQPTHSQTAIPAPIISYDLCNKPVVKIDYSNLPLTNAVDTATSEYNTMTTASTVGNLPLSAPVTNSNFNFSTAAPIINIDLTNIVTNNVDNKTTPTGNKMSAPAIATISIGALPADLMNVGAPSSLGILKAPPFTSTLPPSNQCTGSKLNSNVTTTITMENTTSSSAGSSSSCSPSSSSTSLSLASSSANSQQGSSSKKSNLKAAMTTMNAPPTTMHTTLPTICKTANSNSFLELDEDYDNI